MSEEERPPVTDSAWFWVLVFSLMGIVALAAIGEKYGKRQAGIERQYQARERTAEQVAAASKQDAAGGGAAPNDVRLPEYAMPGRNLIPIWPLAAALATAGVFAAIMLARAWRRGKVGGEKAPSR
jgi:hypothetical protein